MNFPEIGKNLFDMHYHSGGFERQSFRDALDRMGLRLGDHVEFRLDGGHGNVFYDYIAQQTAASLGSTHHMYVNKMLKVIGYGWDYGDGAQYAVAAYCYDGRTAGIAKLYEKENA